MKAFAEFSVALQAYKIPLVGLTMHNSDNETGNNLNTGYIHIRCSPSGQMLQPLTLSSLMTHIVHIIIANSNVTSLVIKKVFRVQYFKWIMTQCIHHV